MNINMVLTTQGIAKGSPTARNVLVRFEESQIQIPGALQTEVAQNHLTEAIPNPNFGRRPNVCF
jgi:hypothetical protein